MSDNLFTIPEVAEKLKVSTVYVYGLIKAGKLRAIRLGKKCLRVSAEDLSQFLESN